MGTHRSTPATPSFGHALAVPSSVRPFMPSFHGMPPGMCACPDHRSCLAMPVLLEDATKKKSPGTPTPPGLALILAIIDSMFWDRGGVGEGLTAWPIGTRLEHGCDTCNLT